MKKSLKYFVYLLAFIPFLMQCSNAGATLETGKAAPNFKLMDTKGNPTQLSDYQGKIVVLEWTNHLCPFVEKHYFSENMQALQKEYTNKNVVWLTIISSAPGKQGYVTGKEAEDIANDRKAAPTKILLDPTGEVGKMYDAKTTPHMYIITKDGNLVYQGAIDSIRSTRQSDIAKATNYVKKALEEVMAGKAVSTPETKPYGCSVKYQ